MVYVDGSYYEGDWKKDKISGIGKLTQTNGIMYEGHWLSGVMNGIVHMTKPSGSVYRQQYFDGRLASSERVKAAPSLIERLLFGAGKEENKPPTVMRVTASGIPRPTTSPPAPQGSAVAKGPNMVAMKKPLSPPTTVVSPRDGSLSSPESLRHQPVQATHSTSAEKSPDPEVPEGTFRRVKSLKDMKLVRSEEPGGLLGRRANSMRRPVSAGTARSSTPLGNASPDNPRQHRSASSSPVEPRNPRGVVSPPAQIGAQQLLDESNSVIPGTAEAGGPLVLNTDVGSDDDEGIELTEEQKKKVLELSQMAKNMGEAPLPPAGVPVLGPTEASPGPDEAHEDVLSAESVRKRRQSLVESKMDTALEKALMRRNSLPTPKNFVGGHAAGTSSEPRCGEEILSNASISSTFVVEGSFSFSNASFDMRSPAVVPKSIMKGSVSPKSVAQVLSPPLEQKEPSLGVASPNVDSYANIAASPKDEPPPTGCSDSSPLGGVASPNGGSGVASPNGTQLRQRARSFFEPKKVPETAALSNSFYEPSTSDTPTARKIRKSVRFSPSIDVHENPAAIPAPLPLPKSQHQVLHKPAPITQLPSPIGLPPKNPPLPLPKGKS